MPQTPGPRTGLAKLLVSPPSDPPTIFRTTINAVIDWLEGNATLTAAGLLASRPVSTPATPGISGRSYYATDLAVLFRDTGTGWVPVSGAIADVYANRPAAAADLNGVRFFATDKTMEWQCIAAAWVLVNAFAPEVTALPASPIDQQECVYLADTANGIKFHLRYRAASSSASKWEVVGQPPALSAFGSSTNGASGYASAFAVTAPLAGDYEIDAGWRELRTDTAGQGRWWGIADGAATPATEYFWQETDANRNGFGSSIRARRVGVTAGTALTMRVRGSGVGSVSWNDGWLAARPVRVGP